MLSSRQLTAWCTLNDFLNKQSQKQKPKAVMDRLVKFPHSLPSIKLFEKDIWLPMYAIQILGKLAKNVMWFNFVSTGPIMYLWRSIVFYSQKPQYVKIYGM